MQELQLVLLGSPEVRWDGVPVVGLNSGKALALLCYLAVTARPHLRPILVDLLWGDMPETNGRNNLSKALTHLRPLVGHHLHITRQEIAFNRKRPYWLDVECFEAQVGDLSARVDVERLKSAVELYRGDFMEGFYVHRAPAFEEWVLARRARLRELVLAALHTLAAHYAGQGEAGYATGIDYTTRLLALEPWREEAHRQLMLLLARSGQRGAALAQYKVCRQVLAEGLDVEPGVETRRLFEQIRDGELAPQQGIPPPVPDNLPAPLTPLVGRKAELAEIGHLLRNPACRLLTLIGPGGIGKTRLALAAAAEQVAHFQHGTYFVSLASLPTADGIVPVIAQALGLSLHGGQEPREQLLRYLRDKSVLLVLDNVEHLLSPPSIYPNEGENEAMSSNAGGTHGAAELVTDILHHAPYVNILVTSRVRLNMQSEYHFPVEGMDLPPLTSAVQRALNPNHPKLHRRAPSSAAGGFTRAGGEGQYSAIKLFLDGARRVQPGFELTSDNLADVVHICRLVGGMPLGILLATTWLEMLSPSEIAARLSGHCLDFLEADWRDVPVRQRGMRAVLDHSWSMLTVRERELIQALSVFRNGFTQQSAQQVTGASLHDLMTLVNKSLLQRTPEGRYDLWHELLRQYGEEKLAQSPDGGKSVRDRHSAHYVDALERWATDWKSGHYQMALQVKDVELDNARVAWDWAVKGDDAEKLGRAARAIALLYYYSQRHREGNTAMQTAADMLRANASSQAVLALIRVLLLHPWFAPPARHPQLLKECCTLLERPELAGLDTRSERAAFLGWSGAHASKDDYEKAVQFYSQSLVLYREIEDLPRVSHALKQLATKSLHTGHLDRAKHYAQETLALWQPLDNQLEIGSALNLLASIAIVRGQIVEAKRLNDETLAILQQVGIPTHLAWVHLNSAHILLFSGHYVEASRQVEACVEAAADLEVQVSSSEAHAYKCQASMLQSEVNIHLGLYKQARALARELLIQSRDFGRPHHIGAALRLLGYLALLDKTYREARQHLEESVAIHRRLKKAHPLALIGLAHVAHGQGLQDDAVHYLTESLRMVDWMGAFEPQMHALVAMAVLLADKGESERAIELYALASRYPFVANSRFFEELAGKRVAAAAETLPADVTRAAQECGRARDLEAAVKELLDELKAAV